MRESRESPAGSKRDVVVRTTAKIGTRRVVGRDGGAHVLGRPLSGPATEHGHVGPDHLGGEALLTLLVLPLARPEPSFDVDLPALRQVLARDLRGLSEEHHAVPLGGFLLLPAL